MTTVPPTHGSPLGDTPLVHQHNPGHARLSALAKRCRQLSFWVLRRSFPGQLLISCGLTMILRFILINGAGFTPRSATADIAVTVCVGIATYIVLAWARTVFMGPLYQTVSKISIDVRDPERPFLETLAQARLAQITTMISELAEGTYTPDPPESMAEWLRNFFSGGGDNYIGIDSHLPTEFEQKYDWYLAIHSRVLREQPHAGAMQHTRVIVSNRSQLTRDYLKDPKTYLSFVKWHRDHNVALRWIDEELANNLRQEKKVKRNSDVGLWDKYAVLFTEDGEFTRLTMIWPSGKTRRTYTQMRAYAEAIVENSQPLPEGAAGIEVTDEDLAHVWEPYVDPATRMREGGPLATFLLSELDGRTHVMDAAAGIGVESVFLIQHGFAVQSNEVDGNLQAVAVDYATRHDVRLDVRTYLWENMSEEIAGCMRFDAVLCLGNSFCMIPDLHGRVRALRAFRDVLLDGGVLIIDERNFQFILDHRQSILRDPVNEFSPIRHGDIMYTGSTVRGAPLRISQSEICWRLFDYSTSVETRDDVETRLRGKRRGELLLYPFKYGELYSLLAEAGFDDIRVFADLQSVSHGEMPDQSQVGAATFLTYVASVGRRSRGQGRDGLGTHVADSRRPARVA